MLNDFTLPGSSFCCVRPKKVVIAGSEATCLHAEVALRHAGVAIRRSRCESEARGNLKRSLASLGTRIASLRPVHHAVQGFVRNDILEGVDFLKSFTIIS